MARCRLRRAPRASQISTEPGTTATASRRRRPPGLSRARAREHGVAHGRGNVSALAGEHLGDEERVAAGRLVEASGRLLGTTRRARSTGSTESGCSETRVVVAAGELSEERRGADGSRPPRRRGTSARRAMASSSIRRPRYLSASSVASSAQCTSSKTAIVGCDRSSSRSAPKYARAARRSWSERSASEASSLSRDVVDGPERARREERFAGAPHDADARARAAP